MIKKLRMKFIAVAIISVFAVLAVIISAINILNYRQVVYDSDKILAVLAENNGAFPKKQGGNSPKEKIPKDMSPEIPYESRYFSVYMNYNGTAVAVDTGKIAAVDTQTAIEYAQKLWKSPKSKGFVSNYRYTKKYTDDSIIIIFLDCTKNLSTFRSFLFYSVIVSFVGLLAVAALVIWLSNKIMQPVLEGYEKQKCFITDAGHEIKTPLTIIDADASILEMECGENEWLSDIRMQTRRLTELTKNLIYLSRMEEQDSQLQMIDFPLSDVLSETAQSFQSVARLQEKSFEVNIEPMINFCGDENAIRQLISILLDNALKYSDEKGSISLNAQKKGRGAVISVYNTAEQVSQEDLDRLFDRFYRADKSRNSQTGGYGIGLSIAKAVTEAHKGRITASSKDGKSLLITVVF